MTKTAVILFNLGGPDSLKAVGPFLKNLFSDPDIFNIPFGQKIFAKIISALRSPKVVKEYIMIGGKSPINEWTEIQRRLLEKELQNQLDNYVDVYTAMRYWHPFTKSTANKIANAGYKKIILLPLYPHYSVTTTGSSFNEWERIYKGDKSLLHYINNYFNNPGYIAAVNERIDEALIQFPINIRKDVQLIFSAHGTPVSLVKKGDPYSDQIKGTVELIMENRSHSHEHHLCYQSKVGPVKWLGPATEQLIEKLASENKNHLLIVPISFVSDHLETLFELDIEYRQIANKVNIENYIVMKGLNDSAKFITALKDITIQALKKG